MVKKLQEIVILILFSIFVLLGFLFYNNNSFKEGAVAATTTTPPIPINGYVKLTKYTFGGSDVPGAEATVKDNNECMTKCDLNPDCAFYSYGKDSKGDTHHCFIKKKDAIRANNISSTEMDSYLKYSFQRPTFPEQQ